MNSCSYTSKLIKIVMLFSCRGPPNESRACVVPCLTALWGPWNDAGDCISPEPQCQSGKRVKIRHCIVDEVNRVDYRYCRGGKLLSTMVRIC